MSMSSIYKSEKGKEAIQHFYQEKLEEIPVPYERIYIDTEQGKTHIIHCGNENGQPIVFLHGASSNSLAWLGDVSSYHDKHYNIFLIDMPGEPGFSSPIRPSWDDTSYAVWLDQVIQGLAIQNPHVIGLSLGGWVALHYAIQYPENVKSLVLLCPAGIISSRLSWILRLIFLGIRGKKGFHRLQQLLMHNHAMDEDVAYFFELINEHVIHRKKVPPILSDQALSQITIPVFLLIGAHDIVFDSHRMATRIQTCISNSETLILPDSGHVLVNTAAPILTKLQNM